MIIQDPLKTYVQAKPRHFRFIFFIDNSISEQSLRWIMEDNLNFWGGRYNPIVPVLNNEIEEPWKDLIKHFDPDYIYYSSTIDINFLKRLNFFNPKSYIEYDDTRRINSLGLHALNLLHEHVQDIIYRKKLSLLSNSGKWDMPLVARDFFRLNIGFQTTYNDNPKFTSGYEQITIDESNSGKINEIIVEHSPYFKTLLAALHVDSIYIEGKTTWQQEQFEIIVYERENYIEDLTYYWNKQLYVKPNNRLNSVIIALDELFELIESPYLQELLYRLGSSHKFFIVSRTVVKTTLFLVRQKIQSKCPSFQIFVHNVENFPYPVFRINHISSGYINTTKNLILGRRDYLRFPTFAFENNNIVSSVGYVIDLVVEKDSKDEHKEIKFPFGTSLHHLVCQGKTRINKLHRISFLLESKQQGVDFRAPSDTEIIQSVLLYREIDEKVQYLPIEYVFLSSAGKKLSAFFSLFDRNWEIIKQYLEERFWLELFRFESSVANSYIPAGRGVFRYEHLETEISGLFAHYRVKMENWLAQAAGENLNQKDFDRIFDRDKKDIFQYHINSELNYLVKRGPYLSA